MRTRDFNYSLPESLIAQHPCAQRTASRLLCLQRSSGQLQHRKFAELPTLLNPGDLLVCNDTRVIPARLYGNKASGGKLEILLERIVDDQHCLAHVRASKSPKAGSSIELDGSDQRLQVDGRHGDLYALSCAVSTTLGQIMQQAGHIPLPPYIARDDDACDHERYQTVYARLAGAVAAPTAGLHFDEALLDTLRQQGVEFAYVTLHVGAGTFQPVRCENLCDHHMHSEYIEVHASVVEQCRQTRARGGRIIAVGTTSVRCLETASANGNLATYQGDTDIFIYPGYEFRSVDALITNFHLPQSTLLMLVSAFASRAQILQSYAVAIENEYRFFSYGDAMFIS